MHRLFSKQSQREADDFCLVLNDNYISELENYNLPEGENNQPLKGVKFAEGYMSKEKCENFFRVKKYNFQPALLEFSSGLRYLAKYNTAYSLSPYWLNGDNIRTPSILPHRKMKDLKSENECLITVLAVNSEGEAKSFTLTSSCYLGKQDDDGSFFLTDIKIDIKNTYTIKNKQAIRDESEIKFSFADKYYLDIIKSVVKKEYKSEEEYNQKMSAINDRARLRYFFDKFGDAKSLKKNDQKDNKEAKELLIELMEEERKRLQKCVISVGVRKKCDLYRAIELLLMCSPVDKMGVVIEKCILMLIINSQHKRGLGWTFGRTRPSKESFDKFQAMLPEPHQAFFKNSRNSIKNDCVIDGQTIIDQKSLKQFFKENDFDISSLSRFQLGQR